MGEILKPDVAEATFSVYQGYAHSLGFSRREFVNYHLKHKLVLDIACGLGGLAKSIHLENPFPHLPPKGIISIDINAADDRFLQRSTDISGNYGTCMLGKKSLMTKVFRRQQYSGEQVEQAFRSTLSAAEALRLPFESNTFDSVFDVNGASVHATSDHGVDNVVSEEDKKRFQETITELVRVVKQEGVVLIGDVHGYGTRWGYSPYGKPHSWKEKVIRNMGLDYRLMTTRVNSDTLPHWMRENWYTTIVTLGVEIMKR